MRLTTRISFLVKHYIFLGLTGFMLVSTAQASPQDYYYCRWLDNVVDDVKRDYLTYYEPDTLLMAGTFLAVSGVFANTGLDNTIHNHWQSDIRRKQLDNALRLPNSLGRLGYYYFPIYLASMTVGFWREGSLLGDLIYHWGYRSLRTMLLGGVQQLAFSSLLGSGKPKDNESSKWQPFRYHNGVSAMAHYGAIPLLTAAYMTDPPGFRFALFALSTLPGIAAINKDSNYFSQAFLGWGVALLSASAVYYSDLERPWPIQVCLQPKEDGVLLAASWAF